MTFQEKLQHAIHRAGAPICVGLDPVPERIPASLGKGAEAAEKFLLQIIDATGNLAAAFKANTAFFEAYGHDGWALLEKLRTTLRPEHLLIIDGKRGDVASTNEAYARAMFERLQADAVTVQPYLGGEPLQPFCRNPERGMFVLCATSNPGAAEIQELETDDGPLYLEIARRAGAWSEFPNVGLVLGTTKPDAVERVLKEVSDLPLLLPGSGVQGGDAQHVFALVKKYGAAGLFNFSRSVLYASDGPDFAEAANEEVLRIRKRFQEWADAES